MSCGKSTKKGLPCKNTVNCFIHKDNVIKVNVSQNKVTENDPNQVNYYLHKTFECISPFQTAKIGDKLQGMMIGAFGVMVFHHIEKNKKGCVFNCGPNVIEQVSKHLRRIIY